MVGNSDTGSTSSAGSDGAPPAAAVSGLAGMSSEGLGFAPVSLGAFEFAGMSFEGSGSAAVSLAASDLAGVSSRALDSARVSESRAVDPSSPHATSDQGGRGECHKPAVPPPASPCYGMASGGGASLLGVCQRIICGGPLI